MNDGVRRKVPSVAKKMRRTVILLLVLMLAVSLCAPALAAQYQDANWLFADWELNGYPGDVGGVYSYDGDATHLCILLVDRTPEREEEIRALLEDAETLKFGDATRSYAEVLAVRDMVEAEYLDDEGVAGIGVTVNDARTDFVVSVDATADRYEDIKAAISGKYGDTVEVVCSEAATPETDANEDAGQAEADSKARRDYIIYMVIYLVLFVLFCVFLFIRRKRRAEERK